MEKPILLPNMSTNLFDVRGEVRDTTQKVGCLIRRTAGLQLTGTAAYGQELMKLDQRVLQEVVLLLKSESGCVDDIHFVAHEWGDI
jgi:hypothetical protein